MALTRATDKIIANADGNLNLSGIVTATTIKVGSAISMTDNAISATRFHGDGSNLTGITGTTINNNAANKVIMGSNTANTLEAVAKSSLFSQINHGQSFLDDNYLIFGDASDLQLVHQSSGAKARIRNTNDSGSLDIESTLTRFTNKDGSTEKLRINSSGFVGINSTTPRTNLQVTKGSSHYNPGNPTAFNSNNVLACFENSDDVEVTLLSPNNKKNIINFGDTDNVANSSIEYDHSINHLLFKVNGGSERFRINNSGAFGLAGTNYGTAGQVLTSGGTNGVPTWTTPAGGKILKVLQVVKTSGQDITSSSFTDITGLSITLTPAATSKCLVHAVVTGYGEWTSTYYGNNKMQIVRGSTSIGVDLRTIRMQTHSSTDYLQTGSPLTQTILDTHGADGSTAVTYKCQGLTNSGHMYVNSSYSTYSSLTVYEVAPN